MTDLLIRDVDPDTHKELQRRAARTGVSVQAYVSRLLDEHAAQPSLHDWLARTEDLARHPELSGADLVSAAELQLNTVFGYSPIVARRFAGREDEAGAGTDLEYAGSFAPTWGQIASPLWPAPGNHEYATPGAAGYFRYFGSQAGDPSRGYYSYDVGNVHVVALNSIEYPINPPPSRAYSYSLDATQLEWLRRDIATVPKNKVIVVASHSPLLEFWYSPSHRTKQLDEIYAIFEGREVVAVSGHTHMSENLRKGDFVAGWADVLDSRKGLPFTHLTVGAMSGHWYRGRVLDAGYPDCDPARRDASRGADPGHPGPQCHRAVRLPTDTRADQRVAFARPWATASAGEKLAGRARS
jgi:plasmid stability protein